MTMGRLWVWLSVHVRLLTGGSSLACEAWDPPGQTSAKLTPRA